MAEPTSSPKKRKKKASSPAPEPDTTLRHEEENRDVSEPLGEAEDKPKKAYDIAIFTGWCKGCGICAAFCPRQCIEMGEDGHPVVTQPDRCTGCGFCEIHCPDFAISVRARKKAVGDED
ncbi:MAG: 4Fe-4S dicluster domain-containing protein [Desulfosoma sp.]